jgi:hypothetical protein
MKHYLCRYWWRGLCIFKKDDCRLAHGLEDLQWSDRLVPRAFEKELREAHNPLRVNERALIRARTYRVLYYYQFEMLKQGKLEQHQLRTVFMIDQVKEYRDQIRDAIRQELVVGFYKKVS